MKIFRKTDLINESVTLFDEEDRELAEGSRKAGRLGMRCHGQDYTSEWQNPGNLLAAFPIEGTLFRANAIPEYRVRLENTSIKLESELTKESVDVTLFDREGVLSDRSAESAFAKDSFRKYLSVRESTLSISRVLRGKPPLYCEGTYRGDSHGILLALVLLGLCYRANWDQRPLMSTVRIRLSPGRHRVHSSRMPNSWNFSKAACLLGVAGILSTSSVLAGKAAVAALLGGQSGAPFASILRADDAVEPLENLPPTGLTYRVALNSSKLGLIGGTSGSNAYAAHVRGNGRAIPIDGLIAPGEIYTVALNDFGKGIIGGGHLDSNVPYAALVSVQGKAKRLDVPASGLIYSVAIDGSQEAIIGGIGPSNSAYAALVAPGGKVTPLAGLPSTGGIFWVAMNDSRWRFIGGQGGASIYAAFVSRQGEVRPVSGLPSGLLYSVGLNKNGAAIVGGKSNDRPYAALVSRNGGITPITGLPVTEGIIYNVTLNDSGTGLIAGFSTAGPFAAFVAPNGTATPIGGLPSGQGFADGISLDRAGYGIVGGESNGVPFAVRVAPDGELTFFDGLPATGAVNTISGFAPRRVSAPQGAEIGSFRTGGASRPPPPLAVDLAPGVGTDVSQSGTPAGGKPLFFDIHSGWTSRMDRDFRPLCPSSQRSFRAWVRGVLLLLPIGILIGGEMPDAGLLDRLRSPNPQISAPAFGEAKKGGRVSDEVWSVALESFFAAPKPQNQKEAVHRLSQTAALMEMAGKADSKTVAASLRPRLADEKTVWFAVEIAGQTSEIASALAPELIKAMSHSNPSVRNFAGRALGTAGSVAAVPVLIKALQADPDEEVREIAAESLGKIGDTSPATLDALIQALFRDDGANMFADDALLILEFDPKPYLNQWVKCADLTLVPEAVLAKMPQVGSGAIGPIFEHAKTKPINEVFTDCDLLAALGEKSVPDLEPFLQSKDDHERLLSFSAVTAIRNGAGGNPEWIKAYLDDRVLEIRIKAIQGYADSGASLEKKLAVLGQKLLSCTGPERQAVAGFIADLAGEGRPLLRPLIDQLATAKENRMPLGIAILAIEPSSQDGRAAIQTALNSSDPDIVSDTLWKLSFRPPVGRLFLPQLKEMQKRSDLDPELKELVVSTIGELETPREQIFRDRAFSGFGSPRR